MIEIYGRGRWGRSGRIASEYGRVGRRLSEKDTVEACAVDSRWRRVNNAVLRMLTSSSILQRIWFDVSNDHYSGDSLSPNRSITEITHSRSCTAGVLRLNFALKQLVMTTNEHIFGRIRHQIHSRALQLTKPTLCPSFHRNHANPTYTADPKLFISKTLKPKNPRKNLTLY